MTFILGEVKIKQKKAITHDFATQAPKWNDTILKSRPHRSDMHVSNIWGRSCFRVVSPKLIHILDVEGR